MSDREAEGPMRWRYAEAAGGYHQLRVAVFDDRGNWTGRVIVEVSPAGRAMCVFGTGRVQLVDEDDE